MSATHLLEQAVAYVRSRFTPRELITVQPYAGEFNAAEIERVSYSCPAVLITVLGWQPQGSGGRLQGRHVRRARLAAFVITKQARRELRMAEAMSLADRLALAVTQWRPVQSAAYDFGPVEGEPTAENLYSRAVDKEGQALWIVSWEQCFAPRPDVSPTELFDLVRVDITDYTQPGQVATAPAPAPAPLVVTEAVDFHALPFPPQP